MNKKSASGLPKKKASPSLKNSVKEVVKSPAHGIIGETKPRKPRTTKKVDAEEKASIVEKPKYQKDDLRLGSVISLMKKKPNKKGHKASRLFLVTKIENGVCIAQNQNPAIHETIKVNQRLSLNSKGQLFPTLAGFGNQSKYEIGFIIKP